MIICSTISDYSLTFLYLLAHSCNIVSLMYSRTLLTELYLVYSICGMSVLSVLCPPSLHLEAAQSSL